MPPWSTELTATPAFWIVLKATAMLAAIAVGLALARRWTSAAMRHQVWTLALVCALMLPVASMMAPAWTIVVTVSPRLAQSANAPLGIDADVTTSQPESSVRPTDEAAPRRPLRSSEGDGSSWLSLLAIGYAIGLLVALVHLALEHHAVRRLSRTAAPVHDADWLLVLDEAARRMGVAKPVRLLRSLELGIPVAFGAVRPSILIPAMADAWSEDRRRAVLLHELAHVRRHDCLTQALASGVRAVYWFHPLAWWATRQLRLERELACDDLVMAAGTAPREYAGHLLDIAYSLGGRRAPALSVGMARPGQLEGRMRAALDATRKRTAPTLRVRAAGAALAALLIGPIAAARPLFVEETFADPVVAQLPVAAATSSHAHLLPPTLKEFDWPVREQVDRLLGSAKSAAGAEDENGQGTWEIRPTGTAGTVQLRMTEGRSSSGSNVTIAQLEGLSEAQLSGGGGPVRFRLRRDAGTFTFEGVLRNGVGAGTFSFTPDAKYPTELARRGFARPSAREQYQLARHDIGYAFLDELKAQGYSAPATPDLVRAGQHGVDASYLQGMGALGYRLGALDPLITLRDHGVTPDYVRELAELGYKGLPADDLRQARDHGVTGEYVRGMRAAGSGSLPMNELIRLRDHGVTPEYVRELGDAGYRNLSMQQLVRVRDHGITPEYVRDIKALGFAVPLEELVNARDHGVTAEYAREMRALGYEREPMASLVRMRDHGVTPEFAKSVKALGYDALPAEDLIRLRDYGLTAERIREANAQRGSRLSVAELTSWASRGMR